MAKFYQVVIQMQIDGKREMDSIYPKLYTKKGYADRKAEELTGSFDDNRINKRAYVRVLPNPATEEEAKEAYCKNREVWIDDKYGQVKLTPSGWYSSHAPAEELFYRSCGYGYDGNYYVEIE